MVFPVAYTVLPSKSTELYIEILNTIKSIIKPIDSDQTVIQFNPTVALSDFEIAYQNALTNVFPSIVIRFFHFKQAVHKWVVKNGYKKNGYKWY